MTHGQPDWGVTSGSVNTFSVTDMAELAARLDSVSKYDRGGELIWFDSFENGVGLWSLAPGSGGGWSFTQASGAAWHQGHRATFVAGSSGTDGSVDVSLPALPAGKRGLEFAFTLDGSKQTTLSVYFNAFDGATKWLAGLKLDVTPGSGGGGTQSLAISTATGFGTFLALATIANIAIDDTAWHILKLVADTSTGKYVRLRIDNVLYDLSARSLEMTVHSDAPRTYAFIFLAATGPTIQLDGVILTQNEP